MAQIRTDAVTEEHSLGRLAAASPLVHEPNPERDEMRDGDETPEADQEGDK